MRKFKLFFPTHMNPIPLRLPKKNNKTFTKCYSSLRIVWPGVCMRCHMLNLLGPEASEEDGGQACRSLGKQVWENILIF